MAQEIRPSLDLHPETLSDGNVLGLVGSAYGAAKVVKPVGLTGATAATRYVGGTATGHPTTGTFAVGDYIVTADGHIWVCTEAGTAGTWVDVNGTGGGGVAVQDEGTALGTATTVNFVGAGVTAALSGGTATVTVPGGGGGGGGTVYTGAITPGTVVGPVPTSDVVVAGMTVTIPSSASTQVVVVSAQVAHSGGHINRFRVYLDDSIVYPQGSTGSNAGSSRSGSAASDVYEWSLGALNLTLTAGSAHTIDVRWQASDSTSAVTFYNGVLAVLGAV